MDSLLEHDQEFIKPPWGAFGRDATLGLVSGAAKLLLCVLNKVSITPEERQRFFDITMQRDKGVGLLTYCNHTSTFDDPGLPSALLPWWVFWTEHSHQRMRWTMCARDVCFHNELLRQFFTNGKTFPVERGGSVLQPVLGTAARRLGAGDWLHIFPEGKVQPAGNVGAFRQGIGKLVCDARAHSGQDPIVLPYFHSGMAKVLPMHCTVPNVGKEVTVVVGEPVDLKHITCRCNHPGENQQEVWRDIAAVLREALLQLEQRAPPNPNQLEERPGLKEELERRRRRRHAEGGNGALQPDSFMVDSQQQHAMGQAAGQVQLQGTGQHVIQLKQQQQGRMGLAQQEVGVKGTWQAVQQQDQQQQQWQAQGEIDLTLVLQQQLAYLAAEPGWLQDQEQRQVLSNQRLLRWQESSEGREVAQVLVQQQWKKQEQQLQLRERWRQRQQQQERLWRSWHAHVALAQCHFTTQVMHE